MNVIPLRAGENRMEITPYLTLCEGVDFQNINITYEERGNQSITNVNKIGASITAGYASINYEVIFNALPGYTELIVRFSVGDLEGFTVFPFHVIGVVIYDVVDSSNVFYSGANANTIEFEEDSSVAVIKTFKAVVYDGSDKTTLESKTIKFVVPDDVVVGWDGDCPITDEASSLTDQCSMAFSHNYENFSIRFPPNALYSDSQYINITWDGFARVEQEAGTDFDNTDTPPLGNDVVSSIVLSSSATSNAKSSSITTVVTISVSLSVAVLLVLIVCLWFCLRARRTLQKSQNRLLGTHFHNWLRGDVSSLRTTAGRTVGVVEDPLSEGNTVMAPTEYGSGDDLFHRFIQAQVPTAQQQSQMNHTRDVQQNAQENDDTFSPAEDNVDGILPLDRFSADKSVTKLILPRGVVARGVELESSTDGGSDGDIDDEGAKTTDDDVEEKEENCTANTSRRRRRRRRRNHVRVRDKADSGSDSETEGDTEETGTVVVGEGRDSRNRTAVGAAIDRVRQVDMLLGPVSRGLVGRNGEPIRGASQSLDEDGSMSRKDPDSAIMSLSTLS